MPIVQAATHTFKVKLPQGTHNFTARGALIYNTSLGNLAVAVLDFGADKTATTSFTVQMPANTATSALIRIS